MSMNEHKEQGANADFKPQPAALFNVYVLQSIHGAYFGTFSTRASAEKKRDELFAGDEDSLSRIVIEELEVLP